MLGDCEKPTSTALLLSYFNRKSGVPETLVIKEFHFSTPLRGALEMRVVISGYSVLELLFCDFRLKIIGF